MRKELTIAVLAVGMTLAMASFTTAQQSQDTDVDVNVSSVTQLDVRPSQIAYGQGNDNGLEPGDSRVISDDGYEHIEIANIGSENIATISAEATMPANQTFGAIGNEVTQENFDTGNFVTVSTETAAGSGYNFESELNDVSVMHHLNRVEYVEETPPTYITTSDDEGEDPTADGGTPALASAEPAEVGRFRVGGAEYFFTFYSADGSAASSTDWILRIGNTPHTSTQLGTVDFSNDGGDYTEYTNSDATDGDVAGVSYIANQEFVSFDTDSAFTGNSLLSGGSAIASPGDEVTNPEVRDYNLWLNFDNTEATENHIVRTKYNTNVDSPISADTPYGEVTTGGQLPILSTTNAAEQLQPGQSFPVNVGVQIPLGVDQSRINSGTVTVLASGE